MAREQPDVIVFRHRVPWYGWLWAIGGLAAVVRLVVAFAPALEPTASEGVGHRDMALRLAIAIISLWLAPLLPVAVKSYALRWRVALGGQGVAWRDPWAGRGSLPWRRIAAVGEPDVTSLPARWGSRSRWRIQVRVITDRGRVDLYTEMFPQRRRGLYEAIAERAGLSDTIVLSGREFRCQPGWSPEEFWRQVGQGR